MSEEEKETKKEAKPKVRPPAKEDEKLKAELEKAFGAAVEVWIPRAKRMFIRVKPGDHRKVIQWMKDNWDLQHVTTVTGVDKGETFEVIYHLYKYQGYRTYPSVRAEIPRKKPKIETIVDILPSAIFYEREVHDLLGIVFENHPNLARLILPDDWPEGVYPLRKDWLPEGVE
jgi:NADH:ubiquinone oxidoreductase subunit C